MNDRKAAFKYKGIIDLYQNATKDMNLTNFKIISNYLICFYSPSYVYVFIFNEGLQVLISVSILPKYQDNDPDYSYQFVINNIT